MKKLFAAKLHLAKLSLVALSLVSTTVSAHTGHLANETVHGLLHSEHIITIIAIGFITYYLTVVGRK
jgi:hydrogenase/urease accessory protein HupE